MNPRQKVVIITSLIVVVFLAIVGVVSKKDKGVMREDAEEGPKESAENVSVEIKKVFSPVVPKKIEMTKPAQASPTREGSSEKVGIFNMEMTDSGYSPATIAAKKGDIVQILLRAVDDDYDFAIPYVGIYKFMKKGKEGMVSFEATDVGALVFQCRDACPREGGEGEIVIIP